jgi:hypothetical protein
MQTTNIINIKKLKIGIEFPAAVYHISSRGNERIQDAVERYGYT